MGKEMVKEKNIMEMERQNLKDYIIMEEYGVV